MKAVLVGNGFIGANHRNGYRILKEEGSDITLEAICDIRPEKLVENDGARTYTDLDEMRRSTSLSYASPPSFTQSFQLSVWRQATTFFAKSQWR